MKKAKHIPQSLGDKYSLNKTDRVILQIRMKYPRASVREISEELGVSKSCVQKSMEKVESRAAWDEFCARREMNAERYLRSYEKKAGEVLIEMLLKSKDELRLKAAIKILVSTGALKEKLGIDLHNIESKKIVTPLQQKEFKIEHKEK